LLLSYFSFYFLILPLEESESISPGVILDYDQAGNVIGIEILNASQKIENFSPNVQVAISSR
jgi:uncharacterized protein YuzE